MPTSLLWTDAFPETEIVAVVTDAVGADVSTGVTETDEEAVESPALLTAFRVIE